MVVLSRREAAQQLSPDMGVIWEKYLKAFQKTFKTFAG